MNVILNPDRTRKNVVSVSEEVARSPECPVAILPEDIFVTNAPAVPEDMHTPRLTVDGVWEEANPAAYAVQVEAAAAKEVRRMRDILLTECDYIMMPDYSLADKTAWATYRQALRDISQQPEFPFVITWPVKPV